MSRTLSLRPARKIRITPISDLARRTREVQDLIAERAHQLYRYDERVSDDLEQWLKDWVQAESEVLCPVAVRFLETATRLDVELSVPGFSPAELQLSLDSVCLAISGKKANGGHGMKNPVRELFRVFTLPAAVQPAGLVVSFDDGTLRLSIPKKRRKRAAVHISPAGYCQQLKGKLNVPAAFALLLLA